MSNLGQVVRKGQLLLDIALGKMTSQVANVEANVIAL